MTPLLRQFADSGRVWARYKTPVAGLKRRFGPAECLALAELDALHETLSGPATVHLCQRAWQLYGDARYRQLATISVAHLYNLRRTAVYRVYHINAVDCVTQWQLVACCERIGESFPLPVIALLLEQFPFQIRQGRLTLKPLRPLAQAQTSIGNDCSSDPHENGRHR